jgi:hypothetical protein
MWDLFCSHLAWHSGVVRKRLITAPLVRCLPPLSRRSSAWRGTKSVLSIHLTCSRRHACRRPRRPFQPMGVALFTSIMQLELFGTSQLSPAFLVLRAPIASGARLRNVSSACKGARDNGHGIIRGSQLWMHYAWKGAVIGERRMVAPRTQKKGFPKCHSCRGKKGEAQSACHRPEILD